ncbi:MAG TPA: hypothetical protein VI485_21850 [Vicinamibacterales bacterium]|nr:hypothetical protein [Vicinamibacterales bacterium]
MANPHAPYHPIIYQIDGVLWLKRHFEGGYLFRRLVVVEAWRDENAPAGWRLEYGLQNATPNEAATPADTVLEGDALTFAIKVDSPAGARPSISGQLRIEMRQWQ